MITNTAEHLLKEKQQQSTTTLDQLSRPTIIEMDQPGSEDLLVDVLTSMPVDEVVDNYEEMLEELFVCRHPLEKYRYPHPHQNPRYHDFATQVFDNAPLWCTGCWIYYSWNRKLVHTLPRLLHVELRTARNKNLITDAEQRLFANLRVGIVGLSIGQNVAMMLARMSGAFTMHLADHDVISVTNTNRLNATIDAVGLNKAVHTARMIYEINPFATIKVFTDGLSESNMTEFFDGLDAVVDEADHFPIKVRIREEAQKRSIAVMMAGDPDSAVVLDVERYDIDQDTPLFNGKLSMEDIEYIKSPQYNQEGMVKIFFKLAGNRISRKMLESVKDIGKKLAGPPQLGMTASLSGVILAFALLRLATHQKMPSGSAYIDLETMMLEFIKE